MEAAANISDGNGSAADAGKGREVKLLVFDAGHVFVDFDWEEVCKGFMARSGRSREELKEALAHVGSLGYERGTIATLDFLAELNRALGVSLTLEEFRRLWTATFHENAEMAALLQSLSSRLPLYLLSNTNEEHYNFLQSTYNVARHFDELILSYQVGCAKPDPAIYHEVMKRSGLPPENCLFVDDLEINVEAARSVGMQAVQFRDIARLKNDLKSFGIEF